MIPAGDEWTMLCPPGRMDEAWAKAEGMRENIREIVESPLAEDHFILINDTAQDRFWADLVAQPVQFRDPPFRMPYVLPVINSPAALINLTGLA